MRPDRAIGPIGVLALMRSPASADDLRAAAAGLDEARFDIRLGPIGAPAWLGDAGAAPDVLVLEVDPDDGMDAHVLYRSMRARFPAAPLIATSAETGAAITRALVRLGAVDFLPQPIAAAELRGALELAARGGGRDAPAARPRGKVVAVLKAGGGAGATTIAVQTACVLAGRHKARRPEVCLLDLDVQFGSAALYLDLDDRVGLADLLDARERIDAELLRSVMGHHCTGLDVLAAPRDLVRLDAVAPDLIVDWLDLARGAYDTVVLDLPGAWAPWTQAALGAADLILLVAQLSVPGVRRAKRQLDALAAHGLVEIPLRLVLNRFRSAWGAGRQRRDAERALGRRFDLVVPNDFRAVGAAVNRGAPLGTVARWSRVARGIRRLADGVSVALAREAPGGTAPVPLAAPARLRRA